MHSSRTPILALTLALAGAALLAGPAFGRGEIFTLSDPRGDDHGDGNYVYPLNDELNEGDLDLLSLTARREGSGTLFELTFARPVKTPGRVAIDYSGTQLDTVARFGFYTLNVDLYIDMDRAPGSGGTSMLPGRLAEIDPASAWERAVILTPRPHEARGELKRMLARQLRQDARDEDSDAADLGQAQLEALQKQIPGDVEERIFFPTQVRVRGSKISFFVPDSFLGGQAKDTWSYVVAVSAADLLQSFDVNRALGRQSEDEEALMILPVSPGKWQDRIGGGREGAPLQPPIMDIVAPEGRKQETILGDFDSRARRPVVLPGVVPAEQPKKK